MSVTIESIVWSKLYIWTLKTQASPKTRKYWADVKDGIVVINPEMIQAQLESAKEKVSKVRQANKDILVICEKWLYREDIATLSEKLWIHYLNYKVPGWVLTNFDTLLSRIKSMNNLRAYIQGPDFAKLTKKEKLVKERQLAKLEVVYKWVKNLKNMPSLVIIVDWMYMAKFVDEVEKMKIDNIIIASSNFNRFWDASNLIVSNVNSFSSVDFVLKYILNK